MSAVSAECSTCEHYDSCPSHPPEVSTALSKADQAAWEAPALRPTFSAWEATEQWAHPCPEWCSGEGQGHERGRITRGQRQHQSHELLVRHDSLLGYWDVADEVDGVSSAHIACSLIAGSRQQGDPQIQMVLRYGSVIDGESKRKTFKTGGLFPDEVRELIAVLQHLLKVGSE